MTAAPVSSSQITVVWNESIDNVGVAGYRLYRNGVEVASLAGQIYSDTGLQPGTVYLYTVKAYDAAGNLSGQSAVREGATLNDPG